MEPIFSDFLLPDELLRALDKLGFAKPTPVQQQVLPPAIEGNDLLVSAATGSGKTAAFLLPMMQRFHDNPSPRSGTRALVLVPTRELGRQILNHFLRLGSYTRLSAESIGGGEPVSHQVASLRRNPDVLIATPGRLLDHLKRGSADLGDLEVLVLDEADRMLDMGFSEDVLDDPRALQSRPSVPAVLGDPQPPRAGAHHQASAARPASHHRQSRNASSTRTSTTRSCSPTTPDHKRALLLWLLNNEDFDKALVFANTRERTSALGAFLQAEGQQGRCDPRRVGPARAQPRDGAAAQRPDPRTGGHGRGGPGARRPGNRLVINLDLPRSGDDYLHRTGRTGRAGEQGLAISLVSAYEWNRMEGIERYLRLSFEPGPSRAWRRNSRGLRRRRKGSGKGAIAKDKKGRPGGKAPPAKTKDRHRDRKNIGKRRKPSTGTAVEAGSAPLKKKP